jgi:hypothetical protein
VAKAKRKNGRKRGGAYPSTRGPKSSQVNRKVRRAIKATGRVGAKARYHQARSRDRKRMRDARALFSNPSKLRRVTGSTGWMQADAVRFVKKNGRTEVYIRRSKPRRKAKGKK